LELSITINPHLFNIYSHYINTYKTIQNSNTSLLLKKADGTQNTISLLSFEKFLLCNKATDFI